MINRIQEPKFSNEKHFIIEINLFLPEKQKKIIISLFISDNIKVKELKEFISHDFDLPINSLKFFYHLEGNLEDSYEFLFEPDKKINLDLILSTPKKSATDLNSKNISKSENIHKNINFEYKINKKNEINDSIEKLNKSIDDKKEYLEFNGIKLLNNNICSFNNDKNNKNKYDKKNNKFNFFSTELSKKNIDKIPSLLNKKRSSNTYKDIKYKNESLNTKQIDNKNVKIINFNINKSNKQNKDKKIK